MKLDFLQSEMFEKCKNFFKKYKYLLIIAAVGAILISLPTGGADPPSQMPQTLDTQYSVEQVEKKITDALQKIEGVGKTEVVLTLKSGTETIYAQDTRQETTQTVIISAGSGVQQPVVSIKNYPTFQGALIVCDGAGSPTVRLEVTRAVSALTGLSADRITVSKREGAK